MPAPTGRVALAAALSWASCWACQPTEEAPRPTVEKPSLAQSKADGQILANLCAQLGQPAGCDLCAAAEWYADGTCDSFCAQPDPDCAADEALSCADLDDAIGDCVEGTAAPLDRCLPRPGEPGHAALSRCCDASPYGFCEALKAQGDEAALPRVGVSRRDCDALDKTLNGCEDARCLPGPDSSGFQGAHACCAAYTSPWCEYAGALDCHRPDAYGWCAVLPPLDRAFCDPLALRYEGCHAEQGTWAGCLPPTDDLRLELARACCAPHNYSYCEAFQ